MRKVTFHDGFFTMEREKEGKAVSRMRRALLLMALVVLLIVAGIDGKTRKSKKKAVPEKLSASKLAK